jgi:hypothetical protein
MWGILGKIRQKLRRAGNKMDQYQEAITFAEAGEHDHALTAISEQQEEKAPNKLLVMGNESIFSEKIIDYALEMAQRMSYNILALNTAPLSCETFKLFASPRNQVCEEFKNMCEKNAELFRQAATERGIPFDHVIMFSKPDNALEIVTRENGDIAFVVSESVGDRAERRAEEGERITQSLYVYSMV